MKTDSRFRINTPNIVYEKFNDGFVVINLDSGNYYSIETVGADILDFIQEGDSRAEILNKILKRYEGNPSAIEVAVDKFLNELHEEGLIVSDGTSSVEMSIKHQNNSATESETEKIRFEPLVLSKFTNMQEFLLVDPIHEIDYTDGPKKKT